MNEAVAMDGFGGGARERVRVDRSRAIAAARRHSVHVRLLRMGVIVGSLGGVALLFGGALLAPLVKLPANVTIGDATLNGSRITMDLPKLSGFRKDGKPYELRARSGVQDMRNPKIIELNEIASRVQVDETTFVNIIAPAGVFDSAGDTMRLKSPPGGEPVRLKSTSGYEILLRSADINFKQGAMISREPVTVTMTSGTVTANGLDVADNGKIITFQGNVKSIFRTGDDDAPPTVDEPQPSPASPGQPQDTSQ